MITLDLVNPEKSDIKYKISQFPDGQQTIDLIDWNDLAIYDDAVKISSRLNSFKDLTKIKNFLDRKILEVEAEIINSDTLIKKEKLSLTRHILQILETRASNNLKLLDSLELEFLKDLQDLTETLVKTFCFDPEDFDLN